MSRGMAWPAVGVVGGGEASAASQPATRGRSTRHDRRCFGRLEQEDQRLKKHYGRWMDIVRSLELESFILTKLTKPFVPVNLVGPQASLPPRWVPASRGSIHFLCVIRRHFRWVRADSGGGGTFFSRNTVARPVGPSSQGEKIFLQNTGGPSDGSQLSGGGIIILHVIRRHFLAAAVDPAVSLSTYSPRPMEAVP